MITIDTEVFPEDISYGSSGGPEFSTEIVEVGDGTELRNQRWQFPRERWNVAYGVRKAEDLAVLRTFFHARGGRERGFLFRSPFDNAFWNRTIGVGNGTQRWFQLAKEYDDIEGSVVYRRKVTRPVDGTIEVKLNGTLTLAYFASLTTGIVAMNSAPAPGVIVTASCRFLFPMRFDTDYLSSTLEDYLAESTEVPLVEVRP